MKFLIVILAIIALHQALSQAPPSQMGRPGGFSSVDPSELDTNSILNDCLETGAQYIVAQGIQSGKLAGNAVFTVAEIYSIYEKVVAGMDYQFAVLLSDGHGTNLNATYTVWAQLSGNMTVTQSNYTIVATPAPPGGYSPVAQSEIDTSTRLQESLNFGVNSIVQQAVEDGTLKSNSIFNVSQIYNVYKKVVAGIQYQFDVLLSDSTGQEITATFTVWCKTDGTKVLSNPTFQLLETTNVPGGFSQVPIADLNTNLPLKESLDFGIKAVAAKGETNGDLQANSVFVVSEIYGVYKKVVAGMDYQFDIQITNQNGQNVRTTFTVWYQTNKTMTLTSSDYQIVANDGGNGDAVITTEKFSMKTSLSYALLALLGLTFIL